MILVKEEFCLSSLEAGVWCVCVCVCWVGEGYRWLLGVVFRAEEWIC